MNNPIRSLLGGVAAAACLSACGQGGQPRGLEVVVAPLELPGIDEAIYSLTVTNALGETVWTKSGLASTRYGDGGGSLTYIGTCDADASPNQVTLVLESLAAGGEPLTEGVDYQNPAPAPTGITRADIVCTENADTRVTFDLTIMRAANQGFFDIAVEFQDVFCSAKLDCQDALLHYPDGHALAGERGPTAVVAFACTGGEDDNNTWLYLNAARVVCGEGDDVESYALAPNGLPGNQGPLPPVAFQTAIYTGHEAFEDIEKCYWNMAFGIDLGALAANAPCRIEMTGTASGVQFEGGASPADAVFPVITWSVPVTVTEGALDCGGSHPLNGVGSGVQTSYTDFSGEQFTYELDCATGIITKPGTYGCHTQVGADAIDVTMDTDSAFSVSLGGAPATSYTLPAGLRLVKGREGATAGCCVDPCCGAQPPGSLLR